MVIYAQRIARATLRWTVAARRSACDELRRARALLVRATLQAERHTNHKQPAEQIQLSSSALHHVRDCLMRAGPTGGHSARVSNTWQEGRGRKAPRAPPARRPTWRPRCSPARAADHRASAPAPPPPAPGMRHRSSGPRASSYTCLCAKARRQPRVRREPASSRPYSATKDAASQRSTLSVTGCWGWDG